MNDFLDDLMSNRSFAAMSRDDERETVRRAVPPVDLRTVSREQWDKHLQCDVTLPPAVAKYLDGHTGPLSGPEADMLADQVAAHHGITAPFFVVCSPALLHTGKAWMHIPEAAPFVTGFYLDK